MFTQTTSGTRMPGLTPFTSTTLDLIKTLVSPSHFQINIPNPLSFSGTTTAKSTSPPQPDSQTVHATANKKISQSTSPKSISQPAEPSLHHRLFARVRMGSLKGRTLSKEGSGTICLPQREARRRDIRSGCRGVRRDRWDHGR
jgi:hypothetical protein